MLVHKKKNIVACLVDTGSTLSIIPTYLVKKLKNNNICILNNGAF